MQGEGVHGQTCGSLPLWRKALPKETSQEGMNWNRKQDALLPAAQTQPLDGPVHASFLIHFLIKI